MMDNFSTDAGAEVIDEAGSEILISNLKQLRLSWNESQTKFWSRFGVTQSRGSRFEKGIGIPHSVAMLMGLYFEEKVSDHDLLHARHISDQPKELESRVSFVIRKNRD